MLNGIRCDKLSTEVATVRVHPDKYKKDFYEVVTFLSQYIDKRALTPCGLPLSGRADLPSGRKPALPIVLSKKRLS